MIVDAKGTKGQDEKRVSQSNPPKHPPSKERANHVEENQASKEDEHLGRVKAHIRMPFLVKGQHHEAQGDIDKGGLIEVLFAGGADVEEGGIDALKNQGGP